MELDSQGSLGQQGSRHLGAAQHSLKFHGLNEIESSLNCGGFICACSRETRLLHKLQWDDASHSSGYWFFTRASCPFSFRQQLPQPLLLIQSLPRFHQHQPT